MALIPTDLSEMPPPRRRSQYDELLEHIDGNCVVIERGTFAGFGESTATPVIRSALSRWARSRGVEIELRYLWFEWISETERGAYSPFEIDGEPVPWGLLVQVRSRGGS